MHKFSSCQNNPAFYLGYFRTVVKEDRFFDYQNGAENLTSQRAILDFTPGPQG
jgi:hypothetical protein